MRGAVDETVREVYRDLCKIFNLPAVIPPPTHETTPVVRGAAEAKRFRGETDVVMVVPTTTNRLTVALVESDWRSGCPDCVLGRVAGIGYFYEGLESEVFDEHKSARAIAALFSVHGLALSMTGMYDPQNWSLMTPLPFCETCRGSERSVRNFVLPNVGLKRAAPLISAEQSDHMRSIGPEHFVTENRAAFGFTSIIGNPVTVETQSAAALMNGPVMMTMNPEHHEVAGGKGSTFEQALASCLGEGLERYFLTGVVKPRTIITAATGFDGHFADPHIDFGYPAIDTADSIEQYVPEMPIEWVGGEELPFGRATWVPANLVYCPYVARDGASVFSTTSTNGAAAGRTVDDATTQSLLELIERDAFWYYARTGTVPPSIPESSIPRDLRDSMETQDGIFTVQFLENPFNLPVVQVSFASGGRHATRTARGTGASFSLELALRRAHSECIQMLESLDSGLAVEPSATDMRHLWFTGKARATFPQFFTTSGQAALGRLPRIESSRQLREHIVQAALAQNLRLFRVVLIEGEAFAVVRTLMSSISAMDTTYTRGNDRFAQIAAMLRHPEPRVEYAGSLFM